MNYEWRMVIFTFIINLELVKIFFIVKIKFVGRLQQIENWSDNLVSLFVKKTFNYRSFGDFLLKSEMDKPPWKQVISPVPQIEQFKIDTSWEFLIVATDGVTTDYDVIQYF